LVNDKSVLGKVSSGNSSLVSTQKEENLWRIRPDLSHSWCVAKVKGSNLRGNPLKDVEDLPVRLLK
jgi:hypothetical protein